MEKLQIYFYQRLNCALIPHCIATAFDSANPAKKVTDCMDSLKGYLKMKLLGENAEGRHYGGHGECQIGGSREALCEGLAEGGKIHKYLVSFFHSSPDIHIKCFIIMS